LSEDRAPTLGDLADWLSAALGERRPVLRPSSGPIHTLALALEPHDVPPELSADALFLHRSRGVGERWPGIGIGLLAVHDGFDRHLTTGPNLRLAAKLGWQDVQLVEWERASGLLATPPETTWDALHAALRAELGGEDAALAPESAARPRVALMNAMRPELLQRAAAQGVSVYLTGQLRPSAVKAAQALGLGVVALGHRRSELWGLRQLARELEAAFPGVRTQVLGQR
jgi:Uncharacterized conserved protein